MMTKKDYIKLAAVISAACTKADDLTDYTEKEGAFNMAREIARQIGNVLAEDNPNFDWARWMNACDTGA